MQQLFDNIKDTEQYCPSEPLLKFKRATDVQATWRQYGWTPPGDDPIIRAKWQYFRTLNAVMEENSNG